MIEFSPEIGFWSPAIFWYCVVTTILCALFTVVVIIGGLFDLKFLWHALKEEVVDESDDGRVQTPPDQDQDQADTNNQE
ncbi:MAG: hypothetical protein ACK5NG_08735 [Chthoniobacterales bacterium]